ncbi:hypothetical protein B0H10DRAFT_2232447 [Mycena sp. CBHHK59/15]|nr:hypothetical protein B0H10DRAFT_2232447 [Mycena sp. CBHHK59/15]
MSDKPDISERPAAEHHEHESRRFSVNAKLANPLCVILREQLLRDVDRFAEEHGLKHLAGDLRKGMLVAQDPAVFERIDLLDEEDRYRLRREITHNRGAGHARAVINGVQIIYPTQFGIESTSGASPILCLLVPNLTSRRRTLHLVRLVNSAPYLCVSLPTILPLPLCLLTIAFGRKKTIFTTCLISFLTCLWSAFTNTWRHLFIARFFLPNGGCLPSFLPSFIFKKNPFLFCVRGNAHPPPGQQFCRVNVIAYSSSTVFFQSGFSHIASLLSSFGFGLINWLFALPAVVTIDSFRRRNLLIFTFPFMALSAHHRFLVLVADAQGPARGRVAWDLCVPFLLSLEYHELTWGFKLFGMLYSPGEGPVPFTYSAEAFPLYIRDLGMSFTTATTWFFNFVLSITLPSLLAALKPRGAFGFYSAWCWCVLSPFLSSHTLTPPFCPGILWLLILLFVRETKGRTLEELDQVFALPMRVHAAWGLRQVPYGFRKFVCGRTSSRN